MAGLVDKGTLKLAFVCKGQQSKRYKIGEKWELNWHEICEVIDRAPTAEAIPVEFIESRIVQLRNNADEAFSMNGGYTDESHHRLWELERLLKDWEAEQEGEEE